MIAGLCTHTEQLMGSGKNHNGQTMSPDGWPRTASSLPAAGDNVIQVARGNEFTLVLKGAT